MTALAGPAATRGITRSASGQWPWIVVSIAVLVTLGVSALGIFTSSMLEEVGLLRRSHLPAVFFYLFAHLEPPMLWLLGAFALFVGVLAALPRRARAGELAELDTWDEALGAFRMRWVLMAAGAVMAVTIAGTWLVFHAYPLAMDEYMAGFEARILLSGRAWAPLSDTWWPYARSVAPLFTTIHNDHTWNSQYLPVYAAMRALFLAVHLEAITNAVLAGFSVVLVGLIGRRLWPDRPIRTWVAVGSLVFSAQFVVMSMTAYAMPAHLCLNLFWLWLYLRDDRTSRMAIPWVGVAALGLHNPFPHALFVAPFLLRTLRERRIGLLAYWAVVYGAGSFMWLRFLQAATGNDIASAGVGVAPQLGGLLSSFHAPNRLRMMVEGMNAALVLDWQTPLAALALIVALCSWRRLAPPMRDLALGLAATAGFYLLFPSAQGHGWGYRYIYGVLGNVVLLSGVGVDELTRVVGRERTRLLIGLSVAATLLFQLPLRFTSAERFTRPFARGASWVAAQDADVVVVPTHEVWYGADLVRNDPFLRNRPLIAAAHGLSPDQIAALRSKYPGRVRIIRADELWSVGMAPLDPPFGPGQR
jgi:hypothetical protein